MNNIDYMQVAINALRHGLTKKQFLTAVENLPLRKKKINKSTIYYEAYQENRKLIIPIVDGDIRKSYIIYI